MNQFNLSVPIQLWLQNDKYDGKPEHISCTQVVKPIKEIILAKNFREEIKKRQDISELIGMKIGEAVHDSIYEVLKVKYPRGVAEKRYFCEMGIKTLTGKPDISGPKYDFPVFNCSSCMKTIVADYKVKVAWYAYSFDKVVDDLRDQLSINKYIMHRNNISTDDEGLSILICFDWRSWMARKYNMPDCRIHEMPIDLDPLNKTEDFLYNKIEKILPWWNCNNVMALPKCTVEEKAKYNGAKCHYCSGKWACNEFLERE